jgi:hypothetical protein
MLGEVLQLCTLPDQDSRPEPFQFTPAFRRKTLDPVEELAC